MGKRRNQPPKPPKTGKGQAEQVPYSKAEAVPSIPSTLTTPPGAPDDKRPPHYTLVISMAIVGLALFVAMHFIPAGAVGLRYQVEGKISTQVVHLSSPSGQDLLPGKPLSTKGASLSHFSNATATHFFSPDDSDLIVIPDTLTALLTHLRTVGRTKLDFQLDTTNLSMTITLHSDSVSCGISDSLPTIGRWENHQLHCKMGPADLASLSIFRFEPFAFRLDSVNEISVLGMQPQGNRTVLSDFVGGKLTLHDDTFDLLANSKVDFHGLLIYEIQVTASLKSIDVDFKGKALSCDITKGGTPQHIQISTLKRLFFGKDAPKMWGLATTYVGALVAVANYIRIKRRKKHDPKAHPLPDPATSGTADNRPTRRI